MSVAERDAVFAALGDEYRRILLGDCAAATDRRCRACAMVCRSAGKR